LPIEYGASASEQEYAFFEALDFAYGHLDRLHKRYDYEKACRKIVQKTMQESHECLIIDRPLSW
jgi:uncharacterized UPF0160 family protein